MSTTTVETRHDRTALVREAGMHTVSVSSALAGTAAAFGTFLVVSTLAGGVLAIAGVDPDSLANDWRQVGIGGAVFLGLTLFVGYLFGGYVAGRMARRAGVRNSLLMVLFSVVIAGGLGALIGFGADTTRFVDDIRSLGVPTTWNEWSAIASIGGAASLAGMIIGAMIGGAWGERWHGELLSRAGRLPATIDLRDGVHDGVHDGPVPQDEAEPGEHSDERKGVDLGDGEVHTHADGSIHAHDTDEHRRTETTRATLLGEPTDNSR